MEVNTNSKFCCLYSLPPASNLLNEYKCSNRPIENWSKISKILKFLAKKAQSRRFGLARRTKNWRMLLRLIRQMKNLRVKKLLNSQIAHPYFIFLLQTKISKNVVFKIFKNCDSKFSSGRGVVRGQHTLHSCRPCKISWDVILYPTSISDCNNSVNITSLYNRALKEILQRSTLCTQKK